MDVFLKKIEDKSNNGGKVWGWVVLGGGTVIGVVANTFPQLIQMLGSIFGLK